MGMVYHANYFAWFEVARTDLLRTAGWTYREMDAAGFALPVVEAHCEYRQSARYDDELDIHVEGQLMSPVRVRFEYRIVRPDDRVTIATGHTVHAALDRSGRPCRLPERVQTALEHPAVKTPS
jgi:acyl-CoA thioester hydrolase